MLTGLRPPLICEAQKTWIGSKHHEHLSFACHLLTNTYIDLCNISKAAKTYRQGTTCTVNLDTAIRCQSCTQGSLPEAGPASARLLQALQVVSLNSTLHAPHTLSLAAKQHGCMGFCA